jgi:hypothetical protein
MESFGSHAYKNQKKNQTNYFTYSEIEIFNLNSPSIDIPIIK